jgi:hypothetical protein
MSEKVGLSQGCETDLIASGTKDSKDLGHCGADSGVEFTKKF